MRWHALARSSHLGVFEPAIRSSTYFWPTCRSALTSTDASRDRLGRWICARADPRYECLGQDHVRIHLSRQLMVLATCGSRAYQFSARGLLALGFGVGLVGC